MEEVLQQLVYRNGLGSNPICAWMRISVFDNHAGLFVIMYKF